jgi:hypothetical protein
VSSEPSVPEGSAFSEAWRALDRDARRRVRRAVNRAQPVQDAREATLAVAVARGQRRFWRYGWLLGPVFAVILLVREPLPVVIANGVFAVVVFGVLALFFSRRARRAEERNLEVARKSKRRSADRAAGARKRPAKKRGGKKRRR